MNIYNSSFGQLVGQNKQFQHVTFCLGVFLCFLILLIKNESVLKITFEFTTILQVKFLYTLVL